MPSGLPSSSPSSRTTVIFQRTRYPTSLPISLNLTNNKFTTEPTIIGIPYDEQLSHYDGLNKILSLVGGARNAITIFAVALATAIIICGGICCFITLRGRRVKQENPRLSTLTRGASQPQLEIETGEAINDEDHLYAVHAYDEIVI
jgi:hypothetical protein